MKRWLYSHSIASFREDGVEAILGELTKNSDFAVETTQRDAWLAEIKLLHDVLAPFQGRVFLEYSIPRMGRRVDAVVLIGAVIFVMEFKVNSQEFLGADIDQVWDYTLDLKNFHEGSHHHYMAPCLVATQARSAPITLAMTPHRDKTLFPITTNADALRQVIESVLAFVEGQPIDPGAWAAGRYCPTPTIIEAATALYNQHSVEDI
jgi:hypothetical protein